MAECNNVASGLGGHVENLCSSETPGKYENIVGEEIVK